MKYRIYLFILGCYLSVTQVSAQTTAQDAVINQDAMTLAACLEYAYQHNQTLQNAALEQAIAKADVGVTKAQGLPQINAGASYTNNVAIPVVYLPAEAGGVFGGGNGGTGEELALRFGIKHQADAVVSATQMLFDGSYFVGLSAARTYADLMQKEFNQSKIDITEQVTKAYYTVLVNQERQKLVSSNYNRLDTLLSETRLMFENGFAEKIDVDRIRVQFNNAKTEKQKLDRLTEVSYLLLKFQMGMPIEQDIQLAGKISEIDMNFDIQDEQNFEYADRVDYAMLQVNRELVKLDLRNNRIQYLPTLTANASYGYNTGVDNFSNISNFSDRWNQYGFFGVSLNVPIFDGLRKHNTIQKNKLQLQQLESQTEQLKNSIDLEIVQAKVNLENSIETLEVQQENLALAREVFNVTKIKYQEGVGSNLEVVTAEDELQIAETNYFNALYDALIAKVDLEKALGNLIEEQN